MVASPHRRQAPRARRKTALGLLGREHLAKLGDELPVHLGEEAHHVLHEVDLVLGRDRLAVGVEEHHATSSDSMTSGSTCSLVAAGRRSISEAVSAIFQSTLRSWL